ncbi:MAG: glutathione S-transferase family protein [Pseudomonadota bacterium]
MYRLVGPAKTRTMRVLWMLEELGVDYAHDPSPPRSDTVRALSPLGKVPVLVDGDAKLTDSTAILTYLADKHGALTHPAGTIERAGQDAVTQFLLDEMDALLWTAARHSFILPDDRRVPAIKDSLRWEFAQSEARLVAILGAGPFLTGDQMTVADIIATHCGNWAVGAKFPLTDHVLKDYLRRMRDRPAYQRASAR